MTVNFLSTSPSNLRVYRTVGLTVVIFTLQDILGVGKQNIRKVLNNL